MTDTVIKEMSLTEFRDTGLLQEANRQFFHPLGLALAVGRTDESAEFTFLKLYDFREDGGVLYKEMDCDKHLRAAGIIKALHLQRDHDMGYVIQPVGKKCLDKVKPKRKKENLNE